jgi:phosphoadenosine phosphosulfate reductase
MIDDSRELIRQMLTLAKNPYVAFSGGKDSTVMLHLIRGIAPDIPAVFHNTGVEARETIEYCRSIPNLIETMPEITFWEIVKKYGYPKIKGTDGSHDGNKCCIYLKENPAKKLQKMKGFDGVFLGITIHESRNRRMMLSRMGALYQAKRDLMWKCYPIFDWTEKQIWSYIKDHSLPYNRGYDLGWRRCGCMPCTAHCKWEERLARENPKLLRYILRARYGQRQCGDYYLFGEDLNDTVRK